MTHPTLLSLLSLLSLAKESGALKKAVLSKPDDPCILRTVLSPRQMRGEVVLQAERFLTDNKAMHENFGAADTERLLSLLEGYAQINLLTTAGDCEWRRSKSGKCTLLGGDKQPKEKSHPHGGRTLPASAGHLRRERTHS